MTKTPVMPLFTDRYLADTRYLNTEQQGAFILLMLAHWRLEGRPLPKDERKLARLAGYRNVRSWRRVNPEVLALFTPVKGGLVLPDLVEERRRVVERIGQSRHAANRRWRPGARRTEPEEAENRTSPPSLFELLSEEADDAVK